MSEGFTPANRLEELMADAHRGRTPTAEFLSALLTAEVFLSPQSLEGRELSLGARQGRDGALYIPAFTSHERLARFTGSDQAVGVNLRDLAKSWPEDVALVIDPGDPVELVLPGHEVRRIAGGSGLGGVQVVPAGTSVMIGEPAIEPEAVLSAVREACSQRPEVAAAYRAQLYVARPGEESHLAIGLVVDGRAESSELQRHVAAAARAAGAEQVSVALVDPEAHGDAIAAYMLERSMPFFTRRVSATAPPSNPSLLHAMRVATESGKPEDRQGIYDAFRQSVVIVPIRDGPEGEREVRAIRANDGRPVVPAFTDPRALAAWASGPISWGSMRGPDLAAIAVEHGARAVVLNPGGPFGGELDSREIDALADADSLRLKDIDPSSGAMRMEVRESSTIQLRAPSSVPAALVEALRETLAQRDDVDRAFLLEAVATGRPHLTLAVKLATGADPSAVVKAAGRAAGAHLGEDDPFDVLPVDERHAESLAEKVEPIW
jgi:SseB protein C-terminal domain/SseB protein N-terminal domain